MTTDRAQLVLSMQLLWLLIALPIVSAVPLSDFYSFNTGSRCSIYDSEIANEALNENCEELLFYRALDSSVAYNLDVPFHFFNETIASIHVNVKGFLSLNEPFKGSSYPLVFPTKGLKVLSAFWNNIDIRDENGGEVYFRPTTDNAVLSKASKEIQQSFADQLLFTANWAFVVTWHKVAYFSKGDKYNTFQLVLVTDGVQSFAINNYADGDGMQWSSVQLNGYGDGIDGIGAQVGFNDGHGINYFVVPDSSAIASSSNVGVNGKWIFRLTYPSLQLNPPFFIQHVGGEIMLSCAPSDNTSAVGWMKNGKAIDESDDRIVYLPDAYQRRVLYIEHARLSDNATYTCGVNKSGTLVNQQDSDISVLRDVINIYKVSGEQILHNTVINSFTTRETPPASGSGSGTGTASNVLKRSTRDDPIVLELVCITISGHEGVTWTSRVIDGVASVDIKPWTDYMAGVDIVIISPTFTVEVNCTSTTSHQNASILLTTTTPYIQILAEDTMLATVGSQPNVDFSLAIDSDGVKNIRSLLPEQLRFLLYNSTHVINTTPLLQQKSNHFQHYTLTLPPMGTETEGNYTLEFNDVVFGKTSTSLAIKLDGSSSNQSTPVNLLPEADVGACNLEQDETWNVQWPVTRVGDTAKISCPGSNKTEDIIGDATRVCLRNQKWGRSNVSQCQTIGQMQCEMQVKQLTKTVLKDELVNITSKLKAVSKTLSPLLSKDLVSITSTLSTLIEILSNLQTHNMQVVIKDIVIVLDNLLNERNKLSLQQLNKIEQELVSAQFLAVTEKVGILLARSFEGKHKSANVIHKRKNIMIDVRMFSVNDLKKLTKIISTRNIIEETVENSVTMVQIPSISLLKHINKTLSVDRNLRDEEDKPVSKSEQSAISAKLDTDIRIGLIFTFISNSIFITSPSSIIEPTFIAMTLDQGLVTNLDDESVVIKFTSSKIRTTSRCILKDPTSTHFSNDKVYTSVERNRAITCKSNQLGLFAIENDDTTARSTEHGALSTIGYIGCGISILCISVTIIYLLRIKIFTECFIRLNICISLLIGIMIFVCDATNYLGNKYDAILISFLHFFLMATICWIICEGIFLFCSQCDKVHKQLFTSWKLLVLIGWGVPAVITAACYKHSQRLLWEQDEDDALCLIIPMATIVFIAIILFIATFFKVIRNKTTLQTPAVGPDITMLTGAVVILLSVSCTWTIGILAIEYSNEFDWIFAVLNLSQGVSMLCFYVLLSKQRKTVDSEHSGFKGDPAKNIEVAVTDSLLWKKRNDYMSSLLPKGDLVQKMY